MKIFSRIQEIKEYVSAVKKLEKSIGFVPTMGALHQGHASLIKRSASENDITICSIFVNPTQFNNPRDLENYPRDTEKDYELLDEIDCDAVFVPCVSEIYSSILQTKLSFGNLENTMEGIYRPGHFQGVAIVVSKLFHIVSPHKAYFGKKDLQQLSIIQAMTRDLDFDIQIVPVETVREPDGLAMSSRNRLLNDGDRKKALIIYKSLIQAKARLEKGDTPLAVKNEIIAKFRMENTLKLEYFEIVNTDTLENVETLDEAQQVSICIAAYVGKVRLIDNLSVK